MMNIAIRMKRLLAVPLSYYVRTVIKYNRQDEYLILMYHRIIEKNDSNIYLQDGMYVDPDTFRMQIHYLKDNFNIVPLESLLSMTETKKKIDNNKPCCVITFDDGWNDFYGYAYPILKYYNACSTIFLPTDFIGTNKLFWTDKLAFIMKHKKYTNYNDKIEKKTSSTNDIMKYIENIQGSTDLMIEKSILILKQLPAKEIDCILEELAYKWRVKINKQEPSFLTWGEIKEMRASGVVYFGSHTKSHQILITSTDDVIQEELVQSRNKLIENSVVSPSFIPFAYPNGNYTSKIANMVEEAGYNIALTTERGWNRIEDDRSHLYKLKRVGIHQDICSTNSMLSCRIFGIY